MPCCKGVRTRGGGMEGRLPAYHAVDGGGRGCPEAAVGVLGVAEGGGQVPEGVVQGGAGLAFALAVGVGWEGQAGQPRVPGQRAAGVVHVGEGGHAGLGAGGGQVHKVEGGAEEEDAGAEAAAAGQGGHGVAHGGHRRVKEARLDADVGALDGEDNSRGAGGTHREGGADGDVVAAEVELGP